MKINLERMKIWIKKQLKKDPNAIAINKAIKMYEKDGIEKNYKVLTMYYHRLGECWQYWSDVYYIRHGQLI